MLFKNKLASGFQRLFLWGAILTTAYSCNKKDDVSPLPSENAKVNNWIYDSMSELYYWNTGMPKNLSKEQNPDAFFNQLLNKPTDRFSHITPDYQGLINSLSGVNREAGYEFSLFIDSQNNNNVIAQITYTKRNSPAEAAGLLRGDRIYKINNTQLTVQNYRTLLGQISSPHSVDYRRYDTTTGSFVDKGQLSLNTVELPENPNYISKVIDAEGQKIGYYMYNFFAPGTGPDDKKYNTEMDQIINNFKAAGVNNLVLDLRYNGGGYVSSSVNLASLIGKGVDSTKVFFKNEYNPALQDYLLNDPKYGTNFLNTRFVHKNENIGNQLTGKLVVLVSSRTASASELLINGLRPFMEVTIIGDTTVGKNVGSIALNDKDNPENKWGILPIVFRSYNSLGQSDYGNGFAPNLVVKESSERLRPLGDPSELMLRKAIEHITGVAAPNPERPIGHFEEPVMVGSSLDSKSRQGQLIDNNLPREVFDFMHQ